MKFFALLVIVAAGLGYWVHDQRAKKAGDAAAGGKGAVAAGFQPYVAPQSAGAGPRKARVTGMRLITPAPEFQQQVATAALDLFVRRLEEQAADVLRPAKQGTVRVHVTTGPKYQTVQVQAQGIDAPLLLALHERLMAMERLKVKSADVAFELQLALAP